MRWQQPKFRDVRVIAKFAFLPVTIGHETRWLETVYIKQTFIEHLTSTGGYWRNSEFITKEEYIKFKQEQKK